ncbi:hypothetical protein B1757_02565 [Acidithiobacillus marinus]|uniref:Uncharacterized protein n=1 Tax=Acidithiobacillus marinus TaxID=187490 RepID=A0A2I1DPQ7_9PROT|nr:hypothetical protein [Acidithiobacillus marinus]PKY11861.1 hypothetical protein B1757_02565 [Acidithiobacillus marinus]
MKKRDGTNLWKVIKNKNYGNRQNVKRVEYKTTAEQLEALERELREKKAIVEMLDNRINELKSYNSLTHDGDTLSKDIDAETEDKK